MRPHRKLGICIAIALFAATAIQVGHKSFRWKRFSEVEKGVLYRSGILSDNQLRQAIRTHGIKTVFSFTHTNNSGEWATCDAAGVKRYYCYLPGDGVGTDEPYLRFLQIVQDPKNHPVLVHCSAGVQRTGGAVALYRMFLQDWSFDDAIAEMIKMGNKGEETQIAQLRSIRETISGRMLGCADELRQGWKR